MLIREDRGREAKVLTKSGLPRSNRSRGKRFLRVSLVERDQEVSLAYVRRRGRVVVFRVAAEPVAHANAGSRGG